MLPVLGKVMRSEDREDQRSADHLPPWVMLGLTLRGLVLCVLQCSTPTAQSSEYLRPLVLQRGHRTVEGMVWVSHHWRRWKYESTRRLQRQRRYGRTCAERSGVGPTMKRLQSHTESRHRPLPLSAWTNSECPQVAQKATVASVSDEPVGSSCDRIGTAVTRMRRRETQPRGRMLDTCTR
jgi:hypothetical protein